MATNTGQNYRRSSIKDRTQIYNSKISKYVKRDSKTGKFIDVKQDGSPFKGVTIEKNNRRKYFFVGY